MRPSGMNRWTTFAAAATAAALSAGCSTSVASSVRAEPDTVTLVVGHCWVEPVLFDGERWGLPFEKQFGWGGGEPESWQGSGVMERLSDDRVRYSDNGGAVLTFLPAESPSVRRVEEQPCD